jgi:hypothetical protein
MSCDWVSKQIPLYHYGELAPEDEERLEQHVHSCAACTEELERQRAMAAALDRRILEPDAGLLDECRADLLAEIRGGARRAAIPAPGTVGAWRLFLQAMGETLAGFGRLRQPVGVLALVAIGFFAARFTGSGPAGAPAAPSGTVFAEVRSVDRDSTGGVRIAFDETRRREVSGSMEDPAIQKMLLAAARDDNPSVRVASVDLLKSRPGSDEVRDALLNAMAHDPVAGVRLKALEGLRPLAGEQAVRKTLAQTLLYDENPAVRLAAMDLLVAHADESTVGVLQGLVQKEDNATVRLRVEKALKGMNASIGTF